MEDETASIGNSAFSGCENLTNVTIGSGVARIEENAFYGCKNLTNVYISDIGKWCGIIFENLYSSPFSKAKNLYINGTLTTDVAIPDGVTRIENYAFYGFEGLTNVSIPDSITFVGYRSFSGCDNLKYNTYDNAAYLGNTNNPFVVLVNVTNKDAAWPVKIG